MDITTQEWFKYNVNEDKKSYTIISINWETKRMFYLERYINHDNIDTIASGKLFFDDDGDLIFNVSGYSDADEPFENDLKEINTFLVWNEYENEIREIIKKS